MMKVIAQMGTLIEKMTQMHFGIRKVITSRSVYLRHLIHPCPHLR